MKFFNSYLSTLIFSLITLGSSTTVLARTEIVENRPLDPVGRIQVDNMAGSIEIIAWDKAEVEIRGELGDRVDELEISETTGGLRIRVHNQDNQRRVDESILRLKVPRSANIELESISADFTVRDLDNRNMVMSTVSGDIVIDASTGQLEAESVSGDVAFVGSAPRITVETVGGGVDLQGATGEVRVTTVSGDVVLQGGLIKLGRFETVSGELSLDLEVADGGGLNAQSMSGDVILLMPASQQAEFNAQSYSGKIRSEFGQHPNQADLQGRSLQFQQGNNGASVRIESFSGDAHFKKR